MSVFKNKLIISVQDWDNLVSTHYGKVYSFQQQDDCRPRGLYWVGKWGEPFKNDTVPVEVNGVEMGVSLEAWTNKDYNDHFFNGGYEENLFWERNFYPSEQEIIEDLFDKGLIPQKEFGIEVDW